MKKNERNKKRILTTILVILLICVPVLYGCGSSDHGKVGSSQEQKKGQEEKERQKRTAGAGTTGERGVKDKTDKDNTEIDKAEKKIADTGKEKGGKTSSKTPSSIKDKPGKSKDSDSKGTKKKDTEESAGNKKTDKVSNSKARKKNRKEFCSITIECKVLTGRDDIDPGTAGLLPADGYIIEKKKIEVKSGDSVYSILNRAKASYGFTVSVENTQFGKYIQGIAGIEEKACGDESGWKYQVNGKYPSKSCSKISVNKGDKIVWTYVLKA